MMREQHVMCPRRAGQVRRWHTWPHLREQTVADHTWQVMRVLWAIWPEVPRHVLQHALVHDCGELRVGDVPYSAKRLLAGMEAAFDAAEAAATLEMCLPWGLPAPPQMTTEELAVFKLAELVEMWEWGLQEVNMGNRYATLVVTRCAASIDALAGAVPIKVWELALRYTARRLGHEKEVARDE